MRPAMNSQETFVKPRIPTQYNLDIIVNKADPMKKIKWTNQISDKVQVLFTISKG